MSKILGRPQVPNFAPETMALFPVFPLIPFLLFYPRSTLHQLEVPAHHSSPAQKPLSWGLHPFQHTPCPWFPPYTYDFKSFSVAFLWPLGSWLLSVLMECPASIIVVEVSTSSLCIFSSTASHQAPYRELSKGLSDRLLDVHTTIAM